MSEFTFEIMLGLLIGTGTGLIGVAIANVKYKRASRIAQIENFHMKAKEILFNATRDTTAANGLLLHIHNSGNELTVGTTMYSSVIVETPEADEVSAFNNWQKILVDMQYRNLIEKLHSQKRIVVHTEDMPDGLLKRNYIKMGVTGSVVFEVYSKTKVSYFYTSFPVRSNILDVMNDAEFVELEFAVQKLYNLCRQYHRKNVIK